MANAVRSSVYYQMLPPLAVECPELDGDLSTLPIIFEDVYVEPTSGAAAGLTSNRSLPANLSTEFSRNDTLRLTMRRTSPGVGRGSRRQNRASTALTTVASDTDAIPGSRNKSSRLRLSRSGRSESMRLPSTTPQTRTMVDGQVRRYSLLFDLFGWESRLF